MTRPPEKSVPVSERDLELAATFGLPRLAAEAVARARHEGRLEEQERCARVCDKMSKEAQRHWSGEYGNGLCTAYEAARDAIRAPALPEGVGR